MLNQFTLDHLQGLTLLWSIKEAVYKWHGEGKVDFRTHIDILSLQQDEDEFTAVCHFKKVGVEVLTVSGIFFQGNSLAWVIT